MKCTKCGATEGVTMLFTSIACDNCDNIKAGRGGVLKHNSKSLIETLKKLYPNKAVVGTGIVDTIPLLEARLAELNEKIRKCQEELAKPITWTVTDIDYTNGFITLSDDAHQYEPENVHMRKSDTFLFSVGETIHYDLETGEIKEEV